MPRTASSRSLSASALPGGAVNATTRRSLPTVVSTSQSTVTGPSSGWWIALAVPLVGADVTAVPQLREPGAGGAQPGDQVAQARVPRVARGGGPQVGHCGRLEAGLVLRGVGDPPGGAGEVPPQHVAVPAARPGGVADQGRPRPGFQASRVPPRVVPR